MLEFSVLWFGTPKIRCGNEEVRIQRRKDLALLIYLFVNPEAHSRDTLVGMLWPEMHQTEARASLRKSLSRLKKELGEDSLLITQQPAGLHPGLSLELDTAQFERHVRKFRLHSHSLNDQTPHLCGECQRALEAAARLYKHDFLEGFNIPDTVFEEWQFFQSESLRKSLAEVLEQLTQQYLLLERMPLRMTPRETYDGVQWCTQFVTHIGKELALELVHFLEGLDQFLGFVIEGGAC